MTSLQVSKQWQTLTNEYNNRSGATEDSRWTFVQPTCDCQPRLGMGIYTIRSDSSDSLLDTPRDFRWDTLT